VDYPGGAPLITVGWVGDSRAYWLADPGGAEPSELLTTDHSWATVMIESGRLDRETALADRRAHADGGCMFSVRPMEGSPWRWARSAGWYPEPSSRALPRLLR